MTLDEAIQNERNKAEEKRRDYERAGAYNLPDDGFLKSAEEHQQMAEWLEELKEKREGRDTCEFCKHNFRLEKERPCSICKHNFKNQFERKDTGHGGDKHDHMHLLG